MNLPGPIVITGANGGLGSALVENLLAAGVTNIACQYRSNEGNISEILDRYDLEPDDHLFYADLTSEEDVRRMEANIRSHLGVSWGLVNVAGTSSNGVSWKLSLADFNAVLQG